MTDSDHDVLLAARGVAVGYGAVTILAGVDLTIRAGECVALVGANGSGKTTLFRTLVGILKPLAGAITWHSARAPGHRPVVGYVPQRDQLDTVFPLTVAEIVRMGAHRAWHPLGRIAEAGPSRVAAALAKVGAEGWERRTLAELSGGQRQRVLIARALMSSPELLFLDEPTTGIDRASEDVINAELRRCRAEGIGILMVSHDLPGLVQVATRALLVERGTLADVALDELVSRAATVTAP